MVHISESAQRSCYWRVGHGLCHFWTEECSEMGILADKATHNYNPAELVEDYLNEEGWIWEKLIDVLPIQVALKLLLMPVNYNKPAQPIWKLSAYGIFTIALAWNFIRRRSPPVKLLEKCWGI